MDDRLKQIVGKSGFNVSRIKTDSRKVGPGDIYVAINGTHFDGNDFVTEAFANGAKEVICQRMPSDIREEDKERVKVFDDTREVLGDMLSALSGNPSERMHIYGVTGTNGKTSSVLLLESILKKGGSQTGVINTIYSVTSAESRERSSITTPGPVELYDLLRKMSASGMKSAVIEISSHALDQKRLWGIGLEGAIFTNISPEHMDYHGDMDVYFKAKANIVKYIKPGGVLAVNADDPKVSSLMEREDDDVKIVSFGIEKRSDYTASGITYSDKGTELDILSSKVGIKGIRSKLIGKHNVYNILGAAALASSVGMSPDQIKEGIEDCDVVPGRLDRVVSDAAFSVMVDYAHTPDALEKVIRSVRAITEGRIITVFGCGGDRDRTKRPLMGQVASELSDIVIITNDNPRNEPPEKILKEIESGIGGRVSYFIIENRKAAIEKGISLAGENDVVLIAGKGHEDRQIIGGKQVHFDDKEIARNVLISMGIKAR